MYSEFAKLTWCGQVGVAHGSRSTREGWYVTSEGLYDKEHWGDNLVGGTNYIGKQVKHECGTSLELNASKGIMTWWEMTLWAKCCKD